MKNLHEHRSVIIPAKVTITAKNRVVTVTGPRGTLTRSFSHLPVEIKIGSNNRRVHVDMWFASKKQYAALRTITSHVQNMITGVTKGFRYKMRFVYAHFPINASIVNDSKEIEIRNFLGEKIVRKIPMREGVTIARSEAVKDEIILEGNDIEKVSQSCADIHHKTLVKNKDIRKFLDGIYVSEKGAIEED